LTWLGYPRPCHNKEVVYLKECYDTTPAFCISIKPDRTIPKLFRIESRSLLMSRSTQMQDRSNPNQSDKMIANEPGIIITCASASPFYDGAR